MSELDELWEQFKTQELIRRETFINDSSEHVTHEISIEFGLDENGPYWESDFYVDGKEGMDVVTGFGLLVCAAIDLAQKNGMIPMPPGQEDVDGNERKENE